MRKVRIPVHATATYTVRTVIELDIDDQTSDEEARLLAEAQAAELPTVFWVPIPDTIENIRHLAADKLTALTPEHSHRQGNHRVTRQHQDGENQ